MFRKKIMITINIPHFLHSFSVHIRCIDQAGYKNQLFHSLITILDRETEIRAENRRNPQLVQEPLSMNVSFLLQITQQYRVNPT